MNRLFFLLAIGVALASLSACVCSEPDQPPSSSIYFNGLTKTDEQGVPIGSPDLTDWRTDDVWAEKEQGLFSNPILPACSQTISIDITAFPNPCKNVCAIRYVSPGNAMWRFRFVDENFNVLLSHDAAQPLAGATSFQFNMAAFPKDTVRVYYTMEQGGCVVRGHGDILVEN